MAEPVAAARPVVNNLPAWSDPAVLQIDMAQLELRQETSPSQKMRNAWRRLGRGRINPLTPATPQMPLSDSLLG